MLVPSKLSGEEEAMPRQGVCESTTRLKQVECLMDHPNSQPVIHLADSILRAWWLKKKLRKANA